MVRGKPSPAVTGIYNNELVAKEYASDGKSIVVPHVITRINRLAKLDRSNISVLDLGCANGELLRVIDSRLKALGLDNRVELLGLDYNEESIRQAKQENGHDIIYYTRDLRQDSFKQLGRKLDIIICRDTLHEAHSSFLGNTARFVTQEDVVIAKNKVINIAGQLGELLTERGTFILYDGLALPEAEAQKVRRFKIKNPKLAAAFPKIIKDYQWTELSYQNVNEVMEMKGQNFQIFLSIFKYYQKQLWPIESTESFFYFNQQEFREMFKSMGLRLDAYSVQNNDYGYWSENIELVDGSDFPDKTILLVGSKKYIPSTFDYFC